MSYNIYKLRGFDSRNPSDLERVNLMYYHPDVMKAKGYWEECRNDHLQDLLHVDRHFFKEKSELSRSYQNMLHAVVDESDGVVGWVWYYSDKRHSLPKSILTDFAINPGKDKIFQVSYERLLSSGWTQSLVKRAKTVDVDYLNKERKGVIVTALKDSLAKLAKKHVEISKGKYKLVIYAYTEPTNIASEKVLERNGFSKYTRQYKYDGISNNVWVKIL